MKKAINFILLLASCLFLLSSCSCDHEWINATVSTPKTCAICGATEGTSLKEARRTLTEDKLLAQVTTCRNNEPYGTFGFQYNEKNQLITVVYDDLYPNSQPETFITFTYNEDGQLLSRDYSNPEAGPWYNVEYSYNQSGQLISYVEHHYDTDWIYNYTYGSDGTLLSGTRTEAHDSVAYQEEEFIFQHVKDSKGKIIGSYQIYSGSDSPEIQKYTYDSLGRITFKSDKWQTYDVTDLEKLSELEFTGWTFSYDYKLLTVEEHNDMPYDSMHLNFTDSVGNMVYSVPEDLWFYTKRPCTLKVDENGYIISMEGTDGEYRLELTYMPIS